MVAEGFKWLMKSPLKNEDPAHRGKCAGSPTPEMMGDVKRGGSFSGPVVVAIA
jgi:hypothetical protein